MNLNLPFVGREKEIARLRKLYKHNRHVLLIGAEGIGKTAVIEHLQQRLSLLVCSNSNGFSNIAKSLNERYASRFCRPILPRQHELLSFLARPGGPVVFDSLGWTNLKLSSFFECVGERRPIWLCCHSADLWKFGFYHPFLWKFARVKLQPFELSETRELIGRAIQLKHLAARVADEIRRWHRLSGGNPRALCDLIRTLRGNRREMWATLSA